MGKILKYRIIVIFLICIICIICDAAENQTACENIILYETTLHRNLEGIYSKMPYPEYDCANRSVYRKEEVAKADHYLYYVEQARWSGWMVGIRLCINKGYLSVTDQAAHPRFINHTWEEYDGFRWSFVKTLVFGCDEDVDYQPVKTKPQTTPIPDYNNTSTTTTSATTTEAEATRNDDITTIPIPKQGATKAVGVKSNTDSWDGSPKLLNILLYIVVPVGCFVLILLAIVVVGLYVKKPLPDLDKLIVKETSVRYNSASSTLQFENPRDEDLPNDINELENRTAENQNTDYEYLDVFSSGSFRGARASGAPMYTGYGDKFGSWKGPKDTK